MANKLNGLSAWAAAKTIIERRLEIERALRDIRMMLGDFDVEAAIDLANHEAESSLTESSLDIIRRWRRLATEGKPVPFPIERSI